MKVKTNELTGAALAYMVATAQGWACYWNDSAERGDWFHPRGEPEIKQPHRRIYREAYRPDIDWHQGGPIIEREKITLDVFDPTGEWRATSYRKDEDELTGGVGPTPLIAAMRCFVASKLGDEVDVPNKLAS